MKNLHILIILIAGILIASCGKGEEPTLSEPPNEPARDTVITFTFSSNGADIKGKIFLPASYVTNKDLPSVYLIDFTEQHFNVATDEFQKVIDGVRQIPGFDALVVTLEEHLDIDSKPSDFQEYYGRVDRIG